MIKIRVTMAPADPDEQSRETDAWVPWVGCLLAVKKAGAKWCIMHVPTGHRLGPREWATKDEAMAVLLRCDPKFPAWNFAEPGVTNRATQACFYKFKVALGLVGT